MTLQTSTGATTFTDGHSQHTEVSLVWDEYDPVAVKVSIDQSAVGLPVVTWMVGRALIREALDSKGLFGVGDVQVRSGRFFTLALCPHGPWGVRPAAAGALVVMHQRQGLEWLIDEAESMVPSGSPDESDIITAELELVLAGLGDAA